VFRRARWRCQAVAAGAPSRSTTSSSAPRGLGLRPRPPGGALSALPCPNGCRLRSRPP